MQRLPDFQGLQKRLQSLQGLRGAQPLQSLWQQRWLQRRRAMVIVGGESSDEFSLENMVFQGTVLGPPLWNIFYEDAKDAIREIMFEESVYADDLNAYRVFPESTGDRYKTMGSERSFHGRELPQHGGSAL